MLFLVVYVDKSSVFSDVILSASIYSPVDSGSAVLPIFLLVSLAALYVLMGMSSVNAVQVSVAASYGSTIG